MAFKDHFSGHADQYGAYRPKYPPALFDHVARIAPAKGLAWDCATGNGQAATELAEHFRAVVATDASRQQLAEAPAHDRIAYVVAAAERSPIASSSVDLVTVAQAIHWF